MEKITTYFARLIIQVLNLRPDEVKPFWAECGLASEQIYQQPDMPLKDFVGLLGTALSWSEDPALGLKFGQNAHSYLIGENAFAAINAPNLQQGILGLINYSALQASYIRFDSLSTLNGMAVRAYVDSDLGSTSRTQHEVMCLVVQNFVEFLSNKPFVTGRFRFSFPKPQYADQYKQVFRSPVEFDAPVTSIFIPQDLLNKPSLFYDEKLWQRGKNLCARRMQELNNRKNKLYSYSVLAQLKGMAPPLANITTVAASFHISERTLHRRLQEEESNFRALYNLALMDWAKIYLTESNLSIENIAGELGYMDAANFRRAFKRQTGTTPQQFRESFEALP